MDIDKIKDLIDILEKSSLQEIEVSTEGGGSIYLNKGSLHSRANAQVLPPASQSALDVKLADKLSYYDYSIPEGKVVKAPMVGTYYLAPSPDSKAFVELGKHIKIGDPICIIEAMKIMNQVTAEVSGKVKEILVKDAQAVEFDQPLMILE